MVVLKCKMCGGDLLLDQSRTVGTCQSCGSTMTLPSEADERRVNLFNRANHFRRNNDFDKAAGIYESILNDDSREPEAYWGLVLCKYGIEYVEDPTTHKRIPTCHRTQFGSILADPDYKAALEYADSSAKIVYESEAKIIEEIQKRILEISAKEEPLDVFICYKETNEAGTRTKDSVLAQDLFFALKKEGLRVFFSRISLEDKLGTEYEPYIFAALNSARVMVVIGTKLEYITSPWVRNEWSRFLSLMTKDPKKILIPAYRDMDAYELPDEFSHLQALDMGKLGFMQDLVRGIEKSLSAEKTKPKEEDQLLPGQYSPTANSLLDRAFICLEDKDWVKADELLEQVLNIEPRNPHAYVGKLMTKWQVSKEADLSKVDFPLVDNNNFQKAIRFADEPYQKILQGYYQAYLDRIEEERKEKVYQSGLANNELALNIQDLERTVNIFSQISGYKDTDVLIVACKNQIENIKERMYLDAKQLKASSKTQADFTKAAERFREIQDYKDSAFQFTECVTLGKDFVYQQGLFYLENGKTVVDFQQSAESFNKISGYKDSNFLRKQALDRIEKLILQRKTKTVVRTLMVLSVIVLMVIVFTLIIPSIEYANAVGLFETGKFTEAADAFADLGNYKDSRELTKSAYYQNAQRLMTAGKSVEAADILFNLGDYKDSLELARSIYYHQAQDFLVAGEHMLALKLFLRAIPYTDSILNYQRLGGTMLSAGARHTVGLRSDGTVIAVGDNSEGQLKVDGWYDVVSVATGSDFTVGLKSDGNVLAVGNNEYGQLNVGGWQNIIAVSAGCFHTVGLKSDGTVLAVGKNKNGQLNVDGWQNIIAASAGCHHTVGLKSDGTIVAVGYNGYEQLDVNGWQNIISISAGRNHTVGLKSDGTVVSIGEQGTEVHDWQNIIAAVAGLDHTVGLKSDGTLVAVGSNFDGQLLVDDWKNIIAVDASCCHTVGLKSDGTVVAVGDSDGLLKIESWHLFQ